MSIRIHCLAGHAVTVQETFAGQTVRCPTCQARVLVPGLGSDPERMILAILGPPETSPRDPLGASPNDDNAAPDKRPATIELQAPETKRCPKCRAKVRAGYHLCPHCRMYFSDQKEVNRRLASA